MDIESRFLCYEVRFFCSEIKKYHLNYPAINNKDANLSTLLQLISLHVSLFLPIFALLQS